MLHLDLSNVSPFLPDGWRAGEEKGLKKAHDYLMNGTGAGSDFLGWVRLPADYDKEEFARIQKAAAKIRSDSQALVVIGIGGSYLGARAVIETRTSNNFNLTRKGGPAIYFAGNVISADGLS